MKDRKTVDKKKEGERQQRFRMRGQNGVVSYYKENINIDNIIYKDLII